MNIITTTALANFRKNKSRNILIGFAIALTTLLLTAVPTFLFDFMSIQFQAVGNVYPTFHGMYRDVSYSVAQEMKEDERLDEVGLREDPAYMYCENDPGAVIPMIAVDDMAIRLNKQKLVEGRFPEKSDEIAVTRGLLEVMGISGDIGDRIDVPFQPMTNEGKGLLKTKEFTITGFAEDTKQSREKGIYAAHVSGDFAGEILEDQQRLYRVYFRLAGAEGKVTDVLEQEMKDLGESYGVEKSNIVNNVEYLMATYVDPTFYTGVVLVMIVIMIAGILTIYSIYYVSMLNKVQEYGRLRAIGATKRQIRKLVFREGFTVYILAAPVGILLGLGIGIFTTYAMIHSAPGSADNFLVEAMADVWDKGEVALVKWQVIALALAVSFATVYLSLLRPMQVAGKISAIEAIRFHNDEKAKRKQRKGYDEINTRKLTVVNLGRNKKRTLVTIFSLGATGILFMVIATVISCMNPDVMANEAVRGDAVVDIESWEGDAMHPERSLKNIRKNNPMTEELREQIAEVDGVEKIEAVNYVGAELPDVKEEDGRPLQVGIRGISDEGMEELKQYVTEGSLNAPALTEGTGIIIDGTYGDNFPEVSREIGGTVRMRIEDGEAMLEKEFKIVAIVNAPRSLAGGWFSMGNAVLQDMCQEDLTDRLNVWIEKEKVDAATAEIESIVDAQEFLEMSTWRQEYDLALTLIGYMMYGCYGMLFVFGLIGILNLVNTMINSVHVRSREIGMMQAIGMSGRQTFRMLQMEGLFYTAGTLFMSLGIGSIAGYGVFLWAKEGQIMSIKFYHYPVLPAYILALTVLLVQLLVAYLVNKSLKKQSLIERIRI